MDKLWMDSKDNPSFRLTDRKTILVFRLRRWRTLMHMIEGFSTNINLGQFNLKTDTYMARDDCKIRYKSPVLSCLHRSDSQMHWDVITMEIYWRLTRIYSRSKTLPICAFIQQEAIMFCVKPLDMLKEDFMNLQKSMRRKFNFDFKTRGNYVY